MTAAALKWVALITMVIDHCGLVFFPDQVWMRLIGRLSFPIFAFLLVQGFLHTGNRKKYARRLFLFALIAELPYDFVLYGHWLVPSKQNIMFELLCGMLMLWCLETGLRRKKPFFFLGVPVLMVVASLGFFSYGMYGMCLMLGFYLARRFPWGAAVVLLVATLVFYGLVNLRVPWCGAEVILLSQNWMQLWALPTCLVLPLYNGKKGRFQYKWLFYGMYPGHLLLLSALAFLLNR